MQIYQLKPKTARTKSRQVGRGGRRGKTSGRGTKGQRARSGRKLRPELRDIIKRLPKKRGYRFQSISNKMAVVNLAALEQVFVAGSEISPSSLWEKGLVSLIDGRLPKVKILSDGLISKPLVLINCQISKAAQVKLEAVGGQVKVND